MSWLGWTLASLGLSLAVGVVLGALREYRASRATAAEQCERLARKLDHQLSAAPPPAWATEYRAEVRYGAFIWRRTADGRWHYVAPWRRWLRRAMP